MKLTSRLLQNRKQRNLNEEPEKKKQDKLRVLIVSKSEDNHTVKRIVEDSKKLGHEVFVVDILGAFITYEKDTYNYSYL